MEFASGLLGAELPVDGYASRVALDLVSCDLALQGVGVSALEAGTGQDTELNLRHVAPTGVLGRVVRLQAFHDALGFGGEKSLV